MSTGLRISLGTNIALLGIIAALSWRGATTRRFTAPEMVRSAAAPGWTPGPTAEARDLPSPTGGTRLTPGAVALLERAGLSPSVLAHAVVEDFNRRWDKRLLALERRYAPRQISERERVEFGRAREPELDRELKEALGEEGFLAWDKEQTLRRLNPPDVPMTAEEAEQAYRWQKAFELQRHELQMAMEDGIADTADTRTLQRQAEEELNRKLEQLFGQERLDKIRGFADTSPETNSKYAELNPTPAQARAAGRAEAELQSQEAALARRLKDAPEEATGVVAEMQALEGVRDEALRQIFGAGPYDALKQQRDPAYRTLQQYAGAWELTNQEVQSVYGLVHAYEDQAERLRNAANLRESVGVPVNWHEVSDAIERMRGQTEASLQNAIGSERLRRLKLNGILSTP